ncbi:hypothetical protein K4L06_16035 [Lysobacter sp. BMK333-48F3]|uniref:hypothetical protein n=1 Tax=Lysobacter sp. BMK333-48F3 TaxID=2867962 RepID=UPI001C8C63DE|nr:hypothetical protein [Lysobacter sp. BMK333-48F3]MBX9402820.1 hypothetical protein [Lysobacter sp. BMK333-48F3]
MSVVAILVLAAGLYLAFKLVGFLLKAAMWGVVAAALYCLAAPSLGWPLPW